MRAIDPQMGFEAMSLDETPQSKCRDSSCSQVRSQGAEEEPVGVGGGREEDPVREGQMQVGSLSQMKKCLRKEQRSL